jgi:hypothetical protein
VREKGFALMVSLPRNRVELAEVAFACGADCVKVHLNVEHRASGNRFGSWAEEKAAIVDILGVASGLVGVMPGAETVATMAELEEMAGLGIDFFDAYDQHTPAWMTEAPLAWMAAVGTDWTLERVDSLGRLGIDFLEASIVDPLHYGRPLSARDLADYDSICGICDKPVVVPSQKRILPEDVPHLRRVGVGVLMLGTISLGETAASFEEALPAFREAVDAPRAG